MIHHANSLHNRIIQCIFPRKAAIQSVTLLEVSTCLHGWRSTAKQSHIITGIAVISICRSHKSTCLERPMQYDNH